MLVAEKKITVPEFLQMEFEGEDAYYELINGKVFKKLTPNLRRQRTSMRLSTKFDLFVSEKNLGVMLAAPTDVYLDDFNHVLPDIFFVSKANGGILDFEEGVVTGAPVLIVEILSPGTMGNDRFDKKEAYENAGVREYWLADPNNRSIEVYENREGRFEQFSFAAMQGNVKSKVPDGFEVDVTLVFPGGE